MTQRCWIEPLYKTGRNYNRNPLLHIGIEYALLLQIVRHGILCQKRRLEPDLGPDPFAFSMRPVGRMVTASTTAELRSEVSALDLIVLLDLFPGFVAYRSGDVDF